VSDLRQNKTSKRPSASTKAAYRRGGAVEGPQRQGESERRRDGLVWEPSRSGAERRRKHRSGEGRVELDG